jgi:anti-sigma-K factor RskA
VTTEEYKTSGILEVYACGGLLPAEQAEVASMVKLHSALQEELNRIEKALENYALLYATNPPANLKNKILNNLKTASPETSETVAKPTQKVVEITYPAAENLSINYSWLAAAAVILLLISAALNFYFYSNWQKAASTLALAQNQQTELAGNFQQAKYQLKQSGIALQVLENTATKHITLNGQPKSPESKALIHWNPETKLVLLEVKNLPKAPAGKQYQLWALHNGQPINAGLYNPSDTVTGMQPMKTIQEAEAFAITLEPTGGSTNPTMEEMYLLGKM